MKRLLSFMVLFIFCVSLSCLCTKEDVQSEDNGKIFEAKLMKYQLEDVPIINIKSASGKYSITFADNSDLSISSENSRLLIISEKGVWVNNGNETTVPVSSSSVESYLEQFYNEFDAILMIIEGYTDWSFFFRDGMKITIKKELFSFDADSIMRSVNHRGFSNKVPENTLPAFRMSRLKGFKFVETDVRFTSDGIPVLLHDKTVDRTSNGTGDLSSMTFEQVRSLDFGKWKSKSYEGTLIPSLDEFLDLCAEIGLEPNIELKEGTREQILEIVQKVEQYGLKDKASYISFSLSFLKYIVDFNPSARVGLITRTVDQELLQRAQGLKTDFNEVYIGSSDYGPEAVALCKNAGIPLSVWVINKEDDILSLPDYISGVTSDLLHAGRVIYLSKK